MRRINIALLVVTVAAGVLVMRETPVGQGNEFGNARVTHIGMAVPDIDKAVREYVRVMGFRPPKVNQYPIPMPDGSKTEFKSATLYMSNFFIELNQPVTPAGPFHDHLQARGMGIQHVGLVVPGQGSIDDLRNGFEQQGGRWVLGSKGGAYAYINFQPTLGTTIELNRGTSGAPGEPPPAPGDALPPLASLNVGHVGFAATDAAQVSSGFAKLLGIAPPKVMEYKDSQYPPDAKWSKSAFLRIGFLSHGPIGLEFIESVGGPTPWSEDVARHKGTAAQHLAINVGDKMDEMIRDLVAKGGKWTNGKPGGNYAYLDFTNTLGLVFELNGTSKSGGGK